MAFQPAEEDTLLALFEALGESGPRPVMSGARSDLSFGQEDRVARALESFALGRTAVSPPPVRDEAPSRRFDDPPFLARATPSEKLVAGVRTGGLTPRDRVSRARQAFSLGRPSGAGRQQAPPEAPDESQPDFELLSNMFDGIAMINSMMGVENPPTSVDAPGFQPGAGGGGGGLFGGGGSGAGVTVEMVTPLAQPASGPTGGAAAGELAPAATSLISPTVTPAAPAAAVGTAAPAVEGAIAGGTAAAAAAGTATAAGTAAAAGAGTAAGGTAGASGIGAILAML